MLVTKRLRPRFSSSWLPPQDAGAQTQRCVEPVLDPREPERTGLVHDGAADVELSREASGSVLAVGVEDTGVRRSLDIERPVGVCEQIVEATPDVDSDHRCGAGVTTVLPEYSSAGRQQRILIEDGRRNRRRLV